MKVIDERFKNYLLDFCNLIFIITILFSFILEIN